MFQSQTVHRPFTVASKTQQYSELLLTEKERVQSELLRRLEVLHSGPVAMEDQAPVLHEQFVSIRFNNLAYEKIRAIDAALERLKRGEYGICEECDEPIAENRLRAVPWTRNCLQCQEKFANENGSPAFQHVKAA
jgi:RNA polymerase-binding protein DksA